MDCNKDEAARAKEIAEKKFNANDVMGAKKFALKAQSLYPVLDGIQQMIATLDVYISAEVKINGEPDLYKILGALPQETDEEIRRKYKRLALILHPDKNKSIGAEGAFQLISEACKLLCDKDNRSHYDQRRRRSATANGVPSAPPPRSNGNHNAVKKATQVKKKKSTHSKAKVGSDTGPSHAKSLSTFWTICLRCNLQYEYPRQYLNNNILCRKCQEPFFAAEAPPPAENGAKASTQMNDPQKSQGVSKNVSGAGRKKPSTPNAGTGGFCSQISPTSTTYYWDPHSRTDEGASKIQTASVQVKSKHEDLKAGKKTEESSLKQTGDLKRGKGIDDHGTLKKSVDTIIKTGTGTETASFPGVETGGSEPNKESGAKNGSSEPRKASGVKKGKSVDDHAPVKPSNDTAIKTGTSATGLSGLKNGGSEPSKASGGKKRKSVDDYYAPVKPPRDTTIKTGTAATAATALSGLKNGSSEPNKTNVFKKQKITHAESQNLLAAKARMEILTKLTHWKSSTIPESSVAGKVTDSVMADEAAATLKKNPLSMDVPDAEFHDFDKARTGRCFAENEVWTAYDADDGMPRLYAMVHKVISRNPFKMRMSWLNSKTNSELGPLNWVGSGFSKTCGDFWIGKHETNESLNSFSHKVRWNKGARGAIRIFPAKGDVWALYRNWSPDWNELTADEVIHKYDMVKVLEDYDEEFGISVTPLVKVAGFKTVFHQHMDPKEVRRIPREEIFRFSHHVPSRMLSGQEAPNAPKGCLELDPAATPEDLLRVIKDITEEDIAETEEKAKIGNDVGGNA